MTDYRELLGVSELAEQANAGDGVKIAVLDTGIPRVEDIRVCLSDNLTAGRAVDSGHATFIGSLLFGHSPVTGLCNRATPCFLKVFDGLFATPNTLARGIRQAVDAWHVDLINLSLGFSRSNPCPEVLKQACQYARHKGVCLVAAAGNDGGSVLWPAALPEVICVGSTDGQGRETYSNHGEVDFVVPGRALTGYDTDGSCTVKTGTSFSAALVTGLLALLLARRRRRCQATTLDMLKNELIAVCRDLDAPGYDENTGYGQPFAVSRPRQFSKRGIGLRLRTICATIVKLVKKALHKEESGD